MSSTTKEQSRVKLLIAGTQKDFANATSISFAGLTFTPAALMQLLSSYVTLFDDVDAARVALKTKVAARKAQQPSVRALVRKYVTYLMGLFNGLPDQLADFGLTPRKASTVSVETKGIAIEKRRATRDARHTMGSKQRKQVKGQPPTPANGGSGAAPATATAASTPDGTTRATK